MIEAQRGPQDIANGPLHDVARRTPFFRRVPHEPLLERVAELSVPRVLPGQRPPAPHEDFGRLPRQLEHGVGGHVKAVGGCGAGGWVRHLVVPV